MTGACFAKISDHEILQKIEIALRDVWTFGQIFLFSMLGSKITPDLLPQLGHVLPVMLAGLVWRLLGVALGILITCHSRERPRSILPDTLFCFLCTLPRATIQGALGGKPKELHFFGASLVCSYIFTAAQLYILCYSVTGMILLHTLGPTLLEWSEQLQKSPDSRIQQVAAKTELERTALLDSEASAKSPSRRSSSACSDASLNLGQILEGIRIYRINQNHTKSYDSCMLHDHTFTPDYPTYYIILHFLNACSCSEMSVRKTTHDKAAVHAMIYGLPLRSLAVLAIKLPPATLLSTPSMALTTTSRACWYLGRCCWLLLM